MSLNKLTSGIALLIILVAFQFTGCTNLNEEPYDLITSDNFLKGGNDLLRTFLRPFDHAYSTVAQDANFFLNENSTDELMTPNREGEWFDGGRYLRVHYHTWTPTDDYTSNAWNYLFQGVDLTNNSLKDLESVEDPSLFNLSEDDLNSFIAELHVLRAWFYIRLFDFYRNIPIATSLEKVDGGLLQATPQETFEFIENEIKENLPKLKTVDELGRANAVGRVTQAAAAGFLMRLYFNAGVYIGKDMFSETANICNDIINGKYGNYELETKWFKPFDWDNDNSPEAIFSFPSSFGQAHYHYGNGMYWWMLPNLSPAYFGFTDWGLSNFRYALQPGLDIEGNELSYQLGKPFVKFQKYPDDLRLKKYKNLGNSTREGMFLYGYLIYSNNGRPDTVLSTRGYTLYLRDQVGHFLGLKPGLVPDDKESNMNHADQNSGIFPVKYPYYPSNDPNKISSNFQELRLAEVYYTLAECEFRAGHLDIASHLLNQVRKRNYPEGSGSLYKEDGSDLNEQELIDEWGREFLVEGRRRIDLIRWGVYATGSWWDKTPDKDNHTLIYPIGENVMNINPQFKQNPGY